MHHVHCGALYSTFLSSSGIKMSISVASSGPFSYVMLAQLTVRTLMGNLIDIILMLSVRMLYCMRTVIILLLLLDTLSILNEWKMVSRGRAMMTL